MFKANDFKNNKISQDFEGAVQKFDVNPSSLFNRRGFEKRPMITGWSDLKSFCWTPCIPSGPHRLIIRLTVRIRAQPAISSSKRKKMTPSMKVTFLSHQEDGSLPTLYRVFGIRMDRELITREPGFIMGDTRAHLPFAVDIFHHFWPRFFAVVYFYV